MSRVQYLHQLARCCPPPELVPLPAFDAAQARKNIGYKLQAYKRSDADKDLNVDCKLRLRMKDVFTLLQTQGMRCAACNIKLLLCYAPKDTRQFSVDRLDNAKGHTRDNVRMTCLECNRRRGAAALR